ncbi:hypothetical protein ACWGJ6_08010 [Streptomyces canus]
MSEGKYGLAYDAGVLALTQQDGTLGGLRNRATGLFTVSTLIASFSSTIGLVQNNHPWPSGVLWGLLAALIVVGWCAMKIVYPESSWDWGPGPAELLMASGDDLTVRHAAAKAMIGAIERNDRALNKRFFWYEVGVVVLLFETMLVVAAGIAYR